MDHGDLKDEFNMVAPELKTWYKVQMTVAGNKQKLRKCFSRNGGSHVTSQIVAQLWV